MPSVRNTLPQVPFIGEGKTCKIESEGKAAATPLMNPVLWLQDASLVSAGCKHGKSRLKQNGARGPVWLKLRQA